MSTHPDSATLARAFGATQWLVNKQTSGLSDEDALRQLPFRGNCLNWVLGHMLESRNNVLLLLGEERVLTSAEAERYQRGSAPVTGAEMGVLPLTELVRRFSDSTERIQGRLERLTWDQLCDVNETDERPLPLGERLAGLQWHETYHAGQLELLRQLTGIDDAIIS